MITLLYTPNTPKAYKSVQFGGRIGEKSFKVVLEAGNKVVISDEEYKILQTDTGFIGSVDKKSVLVFEDNDTSGTKSNKKSSDDTDLSETKTTTRKKAS